MFFSFSSLIFLFFFFFNDTATTEIYTLSLHDALPISSIDGGRQPPCSAQAPTRRTWRSEEHTSELQSRRDLVCRLLLEKKKKNVLLSPTTGRRSYYTRCVLASLSIFC